MIKPVLFSLLALTYSASVLASETTDPGIPKPKDRRYALSIGAIAGNFNSSYDSGNGGVLGYIDLEGTLGLPRQQTIPSAAVMARVARKHFISASYFSTRRNNTLFEGQIGDAELGVAAKADLDFNTNNLELAYAYQLHSDDRLNIKALGGLYVLGLDAGFTIEGGYSIDGVAYTGKLEEKITFVAPFPLGGVSIDYHLNRRWSFATAVEAVYLPVGDIQAGALKTNIHARYAFRPSLGILMGISHFNISVDYTEDSKTSNIQYGYDGLYVGAYYAF